MPAKPASAASEAWSTSSAPSDSLSAGEGLEQVAEVPAVLNDARAAVRIRHARAAAVVALDRPDRERVESVGLREVQQPLRIREIRDLGSARVVVDAGQDRVALHVPQLRRP